MEHNSLYDLIQNIEYGTHLHIGVLFFNNFENEKCFLPHSHRIHCSTVCDEIKQNKKEYRRCFGCRNLAIKKALSTKAPFGGVCINGVYEYTHPVVIDGDVACIIYIGNILDREKGYEKLCEKLGEKISLVSTMESDYSPQQCAAVGSIIESYIRFLLEKYKYSKKESNPIVENVKNYLETNMEYDVSISHITKIFHYNPQYLGRLFKKEEGISIKEYLLTQRLERAKELLGNCNETVTWIASKVGFNNVTYFNRQFKEKFKVTPSQYRKS